MYSVIPTTNVDTVMVAEQKHDEEVVFHGSTQAVKQFVGFFDIMDTSSAVHCNVKYTKTSIQVFALYHYGAVCIVTTIGRNMFSAYSCPSTPLVSTYNLNLLAKQLRTVSKSKPQSLSLSNDYKGVDLVIQAYKKNGTIESTAMITPLSESEQVEELDTTEFAYEIEIQVSCKDLGEKLDAMPPLFEISVNTGNSRIEFKGIEDQCKLTMTIELPDDVNTKIKNYDDIANFRARFVKSYLKPLIKGCKNPMTVSLGLKQKAPLFARFLYQDSTDPTKSDSTEVCMFFASRIEQDDDEQYEG